MLIIISCIILLFILILLFINQHNKANNKANTNSSSNSTIPKQTTQSFKPKPTNVESLLVHKRVEELTDIEKIRVLQLWKQCYPGQYYNWYNPGKIALLYLFPSESGKMIPQNIIGICGYLQSNELCNWLSTHSQQHLFSYYGANSCSDKGIYLYNLCIDEQYRKEYYEQNSTDDTQLSNETMIIQSIITNTQAPYYYTWIYQSHAGMKQFYESLGFTVQEPTVKTKHRSHKTRFHNKIIMSLKNSF